MLKLFLVAAFAVVCLGQCKVDVNNTACAAPTAMVCRSPCSLYKTADSCLSLSNSKSCSWSGSACQGNDTMCLGQDASGCAANAMWCDWQTDYCKSSGSCKSSTQTGSSFCFLSPNATDCRAYSYCTWAGQCFPSDRCSVHENEGGCATTSGCYWLSGGLYATAPNYGYDGPLQRCSSCYRDPSNAVNDYALAKTRVGLRCTSSHYLSYTTYQLDYDIVSANSGCDGGTMADANEYNFTCTVSPTRAPTTPSPTRPTTQAPSITPATQVPTTPAPTLSPTSPTAVLTTNSATMLSLGTLVAPLLFLSLP